MKRIVKIVLPFFALIAISFAAQATTYEVIVEHTPVYMQPNESEWLQINLGVGSRIVDAPQAVNGWVCVDVDGVKGWVHTDYLRPVRPGKHTAKRQATLHETKTAMPWLLGIPAGVLLLSYILMMFGFESLGDWLNIAACLTLVVTIAIYFSHYIGNSFWYCKADNVGWGWAILGVLVSIAVFGIFCGQFISAIKAVFSFEPGGPVFRLLQLLWAAACLYVLIVIAQAAVKELSDVLVVIFLLACSSISVPTESQGTLIDEFGRKVEGVFSSDGTFISRNNRRYVKSGTDKYQRDLKY